LCHFNRGRFWYSVECVGSW